MKVGIYVNINRDIRCVTANKLIDIFCKKGIQVFVASGAEEYIKMPSLPLKEVAQKQGFSRKFVRESITRSPV